MTKNYDLDEALTSLGEMLELAGRTDEARASYEQALAEFERKGSVPDVEATRRRLAELGRASQDRGEPSR